MIGIYKITNPSGNVYIGQSMDIARRLKTYKNTPNISQIKLYNSIKKYGWDKHIVEIIEECAIDLLNEKEVYYKQKHINDFGWESALFHFIHDIGISWPQPKEIIEKRIKTKKGKKYNINPHRSTENYKWKNQNNRENRIKSQSIPKPNLRKSLIQYDLSGKFITEWDSVISASKQLNIKKQNLYLACKGKNKDNFSSGYIWKYKTI